jgi:hypothetical protein
MQADKWHVIHLLFIWTTHRLEFLIWNLTNFNWVSILPIAFNCIYNCLQIFNFMQFHHFQTQLSTPMLIAIFILIIDSKFVYFDPQLTNKLLIFFNLIPNLVNVSPYIHASFSVWSLVLDFFNKILNCPLNFNI